MSSSFLQALAVLFAFWLIFLLKSKATPSRARSLTAVAFVFGVTAIIVTLTTPFLRVEDNGQNVLLVLGTYFVTSIATYLLYGYDKRAAKEAKDSRIRERNIHLLELMGGWPGAFLGVRRHRHKTNWQEKRAFKLTTWAIALGISPFGFCGSQELLLFDKAGSI